jgi:hypothetical protein
VTSAVLKQGRRPCPAGRLPGHPANAWLHPGTGTWRAASRAQTGTKEADANTRTGAGALAGLAVPAGLLRLRLRQAVALVLYVDGDLGQRLGVLAAMVRTKKQLS